MEAGDVYGILKTACLGVIPRAKHWRLNYILVQHFKTLIRMFFY
jgi:hypothetical protein